MSKLREIKAAQLAAAEKAAAEAPVAEEEAIAEPQPRMGKMARIKAAQLAEAEQTGINPYERAEQTASPALQQSIKDLAHYQEALVVDIGKIAAQRDIADKLKIKQSVLPTYLPFVDEYLKQGHNYPNEVAVQVMIWLLDIGEIEHGLNLALVLIDQDQRMPTKFDRTMPAFLCDFMYDWAGVMLKEEYSASPYLDTVLATAEAEKWELHPLFLSKLMVMLAKHKERTEEYREALDLCEKAEAINPEKAGVKGLKERLQKKLQ